MDLIDRDNRLTPGWYHKNGEFRLFIRYEGFGMIVYQTISDIHNRSRIKKTHPYFDKWWIGSDYSGPHSLYPMQLTLF